MSEPNLASSALTSEGNHADGKAALETAALVAGSTFTGVADTVQPATPLQHYLDTWAAEHHEVNALAPGLVTALAQQATVVVESQRQRWEAEQAALRAELRQAQLVSHEQTERIRHLEQALDQSLASLSEMRLQVVDQQLLEAQLASTEEISNIQQQAIARLRLQLAQQQQALDTQLAATQTRDRALQTLLHTMTALTQAQQQELEQLQDQIASDRTDVQASQQRLEIQLAQLQTDIQTQQEQPFTLEPQILEPHTLVTSFLARLEALQAHVSTLSQILSDRQVALSQLEAELQQAHTTLEVQQALLNSLQQSRVSRAAASVPTTSRAQEPAAIAPDLAAAHAKIAALEAQAVKQTTAQAMLRHACQELEEERDRQQTRLAELENQTTDMQEQILRQAQQASEYETAIQHWKNRCVSSQSDILKLKALLETALPDPPAALAQVLAALLAATAETTEPGSPALFTTPAFQRETKVDLPDFLIRRRNYKRRS